MSRVLTILFILSIFTLPVFSQERESAETVTTEADRVTAETERVTAETEAAAVEAERTAAETERVTAETEAAAVEAERTAAETEPVAEVEPVSIEVPTSIRNNRFYLESIRLTKLAQDTYEYGDYEASAGFAEEAVFYTQLSDKFVADQLLAEAKRLVDWAEFYNIGESHPNNVRLGKDHYETAVAYHADEAWNESSDSSIKSIEVLSVLQAGTGTVISRPPAGDGRNQYTVRTWAIERDCLWNIAGYDWVYGDPWQWRRLYEANKQKLPDPENPDWVEPGIVLDIPR